MKFSVIIPVYNEEKYIEECLVSIVSQNYGDYEIIVVDCGSTDRTIEICQQFSVTILHSPTKSVSIQRNIGADASSGDFLVFLDADTRLFDDYFKVTSFFLKKYMAFTYSIDFYPHMLKYRLLSWSMNISFWFNNLLDKCCLVGHNIVIERQLFFRNNKFLNVLLEDIDLSERIKNKKVQKYILNYSVESSARKYQKIGILRMERYWLELNFCRLYPSLSRYVRYSKYFNAR